MFSGLRSLLMQPGTFVRNVVATFATQMLVLVLGIAYTAVLGRWLGSQGKGILELAVLLPSMLGLLLSGGIGVANIYYAGSKRLDVPALTANAVTFTILVTLLGLGVVAILIVTGWIKDLIPGVPIWLLWLSMLGFPVELLNGYLRTILQGTERILAANVVNLLKVASLLSLTVLFIIVFQWGIPGALYATLAAGVVHLALAIGLLRQQGGTFKPRWDRTTMRATLSFGLRGHIGNVLQFYNYRLDVFVVNYYVGPAGVGLYNVSARMAEALWFLPNSVGFAIFPRAAASTPETMNRFTPRVFRATLAITVLGAVALALLGRFFIRIVYTAEFLGAYLPMLVLLPGVALLGGGKVLTNEIAGRGYPHYNSANAALALVLTLILDLVLIPRYGIVGAALASTVSYSAIFVTAVLFYWIVSRDDTTEAVVTAAHTSFADPSGPATKFKSQLSSRTGNQE